MAAAPPPAWAAHLPAGVPADGLDLRAAGSLPAAWAGRWADDGSRVVLVDGERQITAAELEERSQAVARRLVGAGLEPGDRILTSAETSAELVVAHVAALRLGIVVVPVNTAYREREVAHVVRDAEPSAAVVDDNERGRWIVAASARPVVVCGPDVALRPTAAAPGLDAVHGDDVAILGYTSGTTGAPKGAMLTHGNVLAGAEALRLAWRWTADDRLVLALPLFHMHGLGVGLHGTLLAGASAVLLPRFEPDGVLDAARDHRATLFFGVPTMYARLVATARVAELGRLRLCASGSAPLPAALHAELAARATVVLERYGMTETLMTVSNPYDGERRAGTVGIPLPCVDVQLSDGGHGEIHVRGPNVFAGYWHRDDATRASFGDGGWFQTGDVAELDDGYLRIVGRTKELIITGGYNVYPREVEDVLRAHPSVADVAVIGTPSDEWGEVVNAAGLLAPYKRPRVVRYVDELPRNALGKVLRHEL